MTIYLYVKQHSITGLKYFGKTTKPNPFNYQGSGKYWRKHIKKHGKEHVQTIQLWGFDNENLCTEFALNFSKNNDIVESQNWANLQLENGLDGWVTGIKHSEKTKKKISFAHIGLKHSDESKKKMSISKTGNTGSKRSEETKRKMRSSHIGRKLSEETKRKMSIAAKGRIPWNKVYV